MSALRNRATPAKYVAPDLLAAFRDAPSVVATSYSPRSNAYLQQRVEALLCALTQPCVVMRETNAHLVNTGNGRQGTSVAGMHARNASRKAQRAMGAMFARELMPHVHRCGLGGSFAVVVLTRTAPRSLDGLNLDYAFKSVIDGIAEGLGINDRSPLVRYVTNQEQGGPRVHRVRCELFVQHHKESP